MNAISYFRFIVTSLAMVFQPVPLPRTEKPWLAKWLNCGTALFFLGGGGGGGNFIFKKKKNF